MSHSHVTDTDAAAFLSGNMSVEARGQIEAAIDECSHCRRHVAALVVAEGPPAAIGRYVVRGTIGKGAMGVVLRAWDPQLEREVAVKLLRDEAAGTRERMVREARAMAKLVHQNVLAIYDADLVGEQVALVMELVDGEDLGKWLGSRRPWREVIERCSQAGAGLAAAHAAGFVHRDVKPSNILCARDGRVLVADFGVVRRDAPVGGMDVTKTAGVMIGTPAYMAAEQLLGQDVDARADQFALAVVMFEGMFGARPFPAEHFGELIAQVTAGVVVVPAGHDVPPAVVAVVTRALSRERDARWPSVQAMLDALAAAVRAPVQEPRKRLPIVPFAGGVALAAVVAVVAVKLSSSSSATPAGPDVPAPAAAPPCRQVGPHVKGTFRSWTFEATYDGCAKGVVGSANASEDNAGIGIQIGAGRNIAVNTIGALPYDGPLTVTYEVSSRPPVSMMITPPELQRAQQPMCVSVIGAVDGKTGVKPPPDVGHLHVEVVGDHLEMSARGYLMCVADQTWYPVELAADAPLTAR